MRQHLDALADRYEIPRSPGRRLRPDSERRDLHEIDLILADDRLLAECLARYDAGVVTQLGVRAASTLTPVRQRRIKGMGIVWDYRPFTNPNGGRITPLVGVHHIPVIRQMAGRVDLDILRRVVLAQGLMIHGGTDGEGNVARYVELNKLCFHARGANSLSWGIEHMHLTTAESWSERQLNAVAWWEAKALRTVGTPLRRGRLGDGDGFVTVRRRGQTTHKAVSDHAGFDDRSDPGTPFEQAMPDIRERAEFFLKVGHF